MDFSSSSEFPQVPGRKKEAALRPEVTRRRAGQRGGRVLGFHAARGPGAGFSCCGEARRCVLMMQGGPVRGSHAARGRVHVCLLPRCVLLHGSPCTRLPDLPARLMRMKAGSCRNEIWDSESAPSLVYLSAISFPPVTGWCSKDPVSLLHQ